MFQVVKVSQKVSLFSQIEEKNEKFSTCIIYNKLQRQDLFTTFCEYFTLEAEICAVMSKKRIKKLNPNSYQQRHLTTKRKGHRNNAVKASFDAKF